MPETTPYTQKRIEEYRGPHSSDLYNATREENYRDLTYLYNAISQASFESEHAYAALFKQVFAIASQLSTLETRLDALEAGANVLAFSSSEQIDTARFDGGPFAINAVDRCSFDKIYNTLTLPKVVDSSVSKIRFTHTDGTFNVANGFEMLVAPIVTTADGASATVETSSPYDAVEARPGRIWERNVVATATDSDGAQCYLYIRIPNELSITGLSNCLKVTPFPVFDVDILELSYSTDPNVALLPTSNWTVFNVNDWYLNNASAVGHVPPGAWTGDEILNAGPKAFYFEPKKITAIRIKLGQNAYFTEGNKYVYTYGLANLDIRYDKFLSTGKAMIRIDAPGSDTINSITSVTPHIWNVSPGQLDDAFSYRVLWETSFNSGTYTTTPVSASQRVWLEVTLRELASGFTPALTSIAVNYS